MRHKGRRASKAYYPLRARSTRKVDCLFASSSIPEPPSLLVRDVPGVLGTLSKRLEVQQGRCVQIGLALRQATTLQQMEVTHGPYSSFGLDQCPQEQLKEQERQEAFGQQLAP